MPKTAKAQGLIVFDMIYEGDDFEKATQPRPTFPGSTICRRKKNFRFRGEFRL